MVHEQQEKGTFGNLALIEGWVSICGNFVLFVVKLWVGLLVGSIALTADAWHTLTDSISSAIVIFSTWISRKPADEEHPFGHGRTDLICSVVIGVMLAMIGFEFVLKAIEHLHGGEGVLYGRLAIAVTAGSIVVKEVMAQFAFWACRKTNNPILRADGWHHRTDALSSVVVLCGILLGDYFWWMDGALGIIVATMIFYASYEILRDSINRLIGEKPDHELLDELKNLLAELNYEVNPHHFHLHRYGDHVELTFHIKLAPELSLQEAHRIAQQIETGLRERMAVEATIHMEPHT